MTISGKLLEIEYFKDKFSLEDYIKYCQEFKHVQQVAYSTYENALTQICFTCGKVRTTLKENKTK